MSPLNTGKPRHVPWYLWPLVPLAFAGGLVVMLPLGIFALLSIPHFTVFPDHHAHLYDFEGTPQQRARLAQWRALHRNMNLLQRIERAICRGRRGRSRRT
jgi:hypothetical protein